METYNVTTTYTYTYTSNVTHRVSEVTPLPVETRCARAKQMTSEAENPNVGLIGNGNTYWRVLFLIDISLYLKLYI